MQSETVALSNQARAPGAGRFVVAAAVVLLAAPAVVTIFAGLEMPQDNLAPVKWPALPQSMDDAALYPHRFEQTFDRSFRGRSMLLAAWSRTVVLGLGGAALKRDRSVPERHVVVGRDDELFVGGEGSIESHRAADRDRNETQAHAWCAKFARQQERAAAAGARYVVLVAPNKQSIHDDALPAWARRVGTPILDLLIPACAARGVKVVDVRADMMPARAGVRTYHRTDSHWNDVGACIASRVVTAELGLTPAPAAECRSPLVFERTKGGDIALLLGLRDVLAEEAPRATAVRRGVPEGNGLRGAGTGKALLAGDSFSIALGPHLASSFAEMRVVRRLPDPIPPVDFVIVEVVERRLAQEP